MLIQTGKRQHHTDKVCADKCQSQEHSIAASHIVTGIRKLQTIQPGMIEPTVRD
jgi:hypothetical protein